MSYVIMYCSSCGRRFVNPCMEDCANLCADCRKTASLDNEINDRFSEEDIEKIARGPVSNILNPEDTSDINEFEDIDDMDYYDDDTTYADDSDQFDMDGDLDEDLLDEPED